MSGRGLVSLIVAVSENGVIGRDGQLPWRLPSDLARFKSLTMGHTLIMGRKTYESIGRPLPGRTSIVLTRQADWSSGQDSVHVVNTLDDAIGAVDAPGEAFVIGGGEVYRLALPSSDRVYLTRVHADVEGDATFKTLDTAEWCCTAVESYDADERNEHPFTFETWERIVAASRDQ